MDILLAFAKLVSVDDDGFGTGEAAPSPAAIDPSIHMACSYTSRLGEDRSDISVGIASGCLKSK